MISGMVSSSSLPDRPSRRDGLGRGDSVVGCSSVSDTMFAFARALRMRFGPEPVKLRIANVQGVPYLMHMGASAILAGKTTARLDIFPQITRFLRSPDAALRNID